MSCLRSLCRGSLWPVLCVLCVLCVLFETRDAAAMFHVGASDLVLCDTTSICVFGVRMFQCVEENSLLPSGFYYQIREKPKQGRLQRMRWGEERSERGKDIGWRCSEVSIVPSDLVPHAGVSLLFLFCYFAKVLRNFDSATSANLIW